MRIVIVACAVLMAGAAHSAAIVIHAGGDPVLDISKLHTVSFVMKGAAVVR